MRRICFLFVFNLAVATSTQGISDEISPDIPETSQAVIDGHRLKGSSKVSKATTGSEERFIRSQLQFLINKIFGARGVAKVLVEEGPKFGVFNKLKEILVKISKFEMKGDMLYMVYIYTILFLSIPIILGVAMYINHHVESSYIH
ncbi:hypothetical protein CCR75_008813 [Bremia lactucae]|uniref:RxLR effector protein n=1 Tax=Bremia lactucae TaxID=4779 RepID=A0A976FGZ4_BRELC|nr:hypothetical protein CCR75_008813 [Bremia lactucae]